MTWRIDADAPFATVNGTSLPIYAETFTWTATFTSDTVGCTYTIGTGSVTTMCKAGSMIGMDLLWLLALCCLFMGLLMEAFGRYAVVTGETAIHSFKRYLRGGRTIATRS